MRVRILILLAAGLAAPTAARELPPTDFFGRPLIDAAGRPIEYDPAGRVLPEERTPLFHTPLPPRPAPGMAWTRPRSGPVGGGWTLGPWSAHDPGSRLEAVAIGDVTGDRRPDVVLTTSYASDPANDYRVFVYPQLPDGSLGLPASYSYLATTNRTGLALTDLDRDGVSDVVVGHGAGITVLLADGKGGLLPGTLIADGDADTVAASDLLPDGNADLISLGWSRGATIFTGDGSGGFSDIEPLPTHASGYNDHEVADLDGDGLPDLAVMTGQGSVPHLSVHLNDGAGGLSTEPEGYTVTDHAGGLGLGDVTGDGLADAVLSRPKNSPTNIWVLPQEADGGLGDAIPIVSYDIPRSVEVGDLDRDGLADVAVLHSGWLQLGVYLQQPGAGLGAEQLFPIPDGSHHGPQGLAVGDFSSNFCTDVAIADRYNGLVVLYGSGCVTVFLDGFESGDTSAWSGTVSNDG